MLLHYSQKVHGTEQKRISRVKCVLRFIGGFTRRLCRWQGFRCQVCQGPDDASSDRPILDEQDEAPSLSDEAQKQIGRKLRLLYEQLEAEPIPDKFVDLLRALAEKELKPR